jgi:hypothetical protein
MELECNQTTKGAEQSAPFFFVGDQVRRKADVEIVSSGHNQLANAMANRAPKICARMKGGTPDGSMPAKVSESARAMVTAGLANEVEAVNQYADVM